jgi:hypothetical protein
MSSKFVTKKIRHADRDLPIDDVKLTGDVLCRSGDKGYRRVWTSGVLDGSCDFARG